MMVMRGSMRRIICRSLGHRWIRRWTVIGWYGMPDRAGFICTRCTAYEVRDL